MKRRQFLQSIGAASLAASFVPPAWALDANNPYRKAIGIQLYTLRNQLQADTPGTIKAVADAGFKQVEAYGFPDCIPMLKASLDNGMATHSSHFAWDSVVNPDQKGVIPFGEILDKAKNAGLTHLVVPYLHGKDRKTLDDYKRVAENCNKGAVEAKKAGIQLAYHNHAFEFEALDGGMTGYDVFVKEFAPEMKFEVDVFWVKVGGVDPNSLLKKLKGRVSQVHLKDLKKGMKLPAFGPVPKDAFKELGAGMIPMEPIIQASGEAGVVHCHVEQDQSPDPIASVQQSIRYLRTL